MADNLLKWYNIKVYNEKYTSIFEELLFVTQVQKFNPINIY